MLGLNNLVRGTLLTTFIAFINGQSQDWTQGKGTQKEYLPDSSKARNFNDAKRFCESLGSTLPIVKSQSENDAIHDLISESGNYAWLGAIKTTDSNGDRKFIWLDGFALATKFTNWISVTQPNIEEDAILLHPTSGRWFHGADSHAYQNTVCERPVHIIDEVSTEAPFESRTWTQGKGTDKMYYVVTSIFQVNL